MKIAPFGLNRAENVFLENVCKSVRFLHIIPETGSPEWQTGVAAGPDWKVGDRLSERVFIRQYRGAILVYCLS
jgi:hypothetical protein